MEMIVKRVWSYAMDLGSLTLHSNVAANGAWLLLLLATAMLLVGCVSLPSRPPESASTPPNTETTLLGRALTPLAAQHPGLSGVYPLPQGMDAFAARMALARAAERTLDVQYYIWHGDDSGKLLANELLKAADRGAHVRLLIDDIGSNPSDVKLLGLDSHTNIEVRLFNPVANRTLRRLGILFDFGRVNRRMHNKSFTVDHRATIIG
jgi:putative cardiolipin synthase